MILPMFPYVIVNWIGFCNSVSFACSGDENLGVWESGSDMGQSCV